MQIYAWNKNNCSSVSYTHLKRDDIDFVIHGGDMSDFGVTDEFLWQRDIMNKLRVPYVALIGNHDCLGTGEETYQMCIRARCLVNAFLFGGISFIFLDEILRFFGASNETLPYARNFMQIILLGTQMCIRDRSKFFTSEM